MEWWSTFGNYLGFFDETPALAFDMALDGPNSNHVGYDLAFGLQASRTPLDVYPSETMPGPGV
ncbi:hypothetical protein AB0J81_13745 [Streptomyces bobili]|jgi:hypothetical protein|uniref:hypothetical protein n=1 Tax=Streptomyces bobili TaxID=67280 RepID=UPI003426B410